MGDHIRLFWGFDPDGKGPPSGPWREGDRWGETYARVNNLIVVSVVGELRARIDPRYAGKAMGWHLAGDSARIAEGKGDET